MGETPKLGGRVADTRDGEIQSVARCAAILRRIASGPQRPADIATHLGLGRSTVHRYMSSMEHSGLLEKHESGLFGPGPLATHLGAMAMRDERVIDVAGPYMTSLCSETRETVVLSLWGGEGAIVTRYCVDPTRQVHVSVREGVQLSPLAAQSQIFLALLDDRSATQELIDRQPEHVRQELPELLQRVRDEGFGFQSVVAQGIHAVASPIFDSRGRPRAALALIGTSDALLAGPRSNMWRALRATTRAISARLGDPGSEALPDTAAAPREATEAGE